MTSPDIFLFFFSNIGMRSLPNVLPSVKFPNFGTVSVSPAFLVFWKKEDKI